MKCKTCKSLFDLKVFVVTFFLTQRSSNYMLVDRGRGQECLPSNDKRIVSESWYLKFQIKHSFEVALLTHFSTILAEFLKQCCLGISSKYMGVFHLQKNSENFYWEFWEFPSGKRAFHLSQVPFVLQAPLRRFTKKPDALVNCSAIFSNASLFVAFPSNKCLFIGMCGYEKSDICMFPSF